MEELAEESRRLKSLISAREAAEMAEIEQVRREGRRLVAFGNSKKSDADKAASRAAKAAEYDEAWKSLATLEQAEYEAAMALKAEGNVLFGAGKHAEAIAKYDAALSQYGSRAGVGEQLAEKVKLLSNKAECCLRAEAWEDAESAASLALLVDTQHAKSLLRRAKARLRRAEAAMSIGMGHRKGARDEALEGAEADLRAMHRIERNVASTELLKQVQQRRRDAKQASDASFRSGFASAIRGGDSGDSGGGAGAGSSGVDATAFASAIRGGGGASGASGVDASGDASDGDGCAAATAAEAADAAGLAALTSASSWVIGIEGVDGYEWLTDCYRLRCDEEHKRALCVPKLRALGHGHLCTGEPITKGFLTFCLLAAERGIIPTGWNWPAFLAQAAKQLPMPLDRGAAKSRWGGENVFSTMRPGAMRLGGRSLVHTAELAYGSSCAFSRFPHDSREQDGSPGGSKAAERARQVAQEVRRSGAADEALCGSVGGAALWTRLAATLGEQWGGGEGGGGEGGGGEGGPGGTAVSSERVARVAASAMQAMLGNTFAEEEGRTDAKHRAKQLQRAVEAIEREGATGVELVCGDFGDLALADDFTRQLAEMKPPCVGSGTFTLFDLFMHSATDAEARTRFAEYPASGCCPKCQIKFMEAPAAAGRGVNVFSVG